MLWLANLKKRSYIIHSLNPEQRKRQIMDVFNIEPRYGSLIIYSGQKPTLGLQAFAEYYRQLTGCVYVTNEKQFYIYNRQNGLWEQQSPEKLISKISEEIFKLAQEEAIEGDFASMRRPAVIRDILLYLSTLASVSGDFFKKRGIWIHCLNGVVEFENGRWVLKPFAADYHSRNRCNLVYDSSAPCPRFKEQLLAPLLENEDIDLLQKYFAQCLLGRNLTQTIMLLTGSGGSGKGTLANILELIVGAANCMQIRPGCIGGRFETNSFIGKTLLTGKESQTSFFTTKGMGILKSLVGDDALRVEFKHSNEQQMIQGTYNVFIVGNAVPMLEFESDDDISAWQRRLRWIKCKNYKPEKPVDNFANVLFDEEGSGILNWCLTGLSALLTAKSSRLPITDSQRIRLDFLFKQSFQIKNILRAFLEPCQGSTLTTEEIYACYVDAANKIGWQLIPKRRFEKELPEHMQTLFGLIRNRDIKRGTQSHQTNRSGYRNIRIKNLQKTV